MHYLYIDGGWGVNLCMAFDKKSMTPTWFFSPNPELSISVRTILTQTLVSSPKSESGCRSSLELASLVSHSVHLHLFSDHHPLRSIPPSPHSTSPNLSIQPLTDPLTNCYFPSLIIYISSSLGSIVLKAVQWGSQLSIASVLQAAIKVLNSDFCCKSERRLVFISWRGGGGIILNDSFIMIIIVEWVLWENTWLLSDNGVAPRDRLL